MSPYAVPYTQPASLLCVRVAAAGEVAKNKKHLRK